VIVAESEKIKRTRRERENAGKTAVGGHKNASEIKVESLFGDPLICHSMVKEWVRQVVRGLGPVPVLTILRGGECKIAMVIIWLRRWDNTRGVYDKCVDPGIYLTNFRGERISHL
jgi:hypothetical protein